MNEASGLQSIRQQTPWPVGFYNFGKAQPAGTHYFNPSLALVNGTRWLLTRRRRTWKLNAKGFNDLVAFKLNETTGHPEYGIFLDLPRAYPDEQFEDPRVTNFGSRLWISACSFQVKRGGPTTFAHQVVVLCDNEWKVEYRIDPIFGNNGGSVFMNSGHEKNWVWFMHDGLPHLIYMTHPHRVAQFAEGSGPGQEYRTDAIHLDWTHGNPRGGTPPVRIGDEYWSFFHSHTNMANGMRQYHMGAYAFQARPPFAITRMTTAPLLSGNNSESMTPTRPYVVFPCGALRTGDYWTVTLGVNDNSCAWIRIPHAQLTLIARPIPHAHVQKKEVAA